jgi:hypothetical protein
MFRSVLSACVALVCVVAIVVCLRAVDLNAQIPKNRTLSSNFAKKGDAPADLNLTNADIAKMDQPGTGYRVVIRRE